ncbi:Alpha/Beta hydrolase protein [Lipomyces orientalis]|uniref:Alpha/Beta hydrolase protein n=1 Tax=Lipomyces orientalis TaxID=1233043 RepID=A0ACC3TT97_9ASCO
MALRLPTAADFPRDAVVSITPPPVRIDLTHAILLLHGIGDTINPFTILATRLNLPRAVVIALQAPKPMPFELGGFHWGDDIVFSKDLTSASGSSDDDEILSPDAEFSTSRKFLGDIIEQVLEKKCGFVAAKNVILWGYGQGGMAALDIAACRMNLCSVISVGGWLPGWIQARDIIDLPRTTSVLLCGGDTNSNITDDRVKQAEEIFKECRRLKFPMKGDFMPRTKEEMSPVLRFLLRTLIPDELEKAGYT